jgi:hypothetical protein
MPVLCNQAKRFGFVWMLRLAYFPVLTFGVDDPGFKFDEGGWNFSFLDVKGALNYNDALTLKAVAENLCIPSGRLRYAEIGSYLGLSATIIANACENSIIYAHDIFPTRAEELPDESHPPWNSDNMLVNFWEGVKRNKLEGRIIPMRGRSEETVEIHDDGSLDMVFVDGDHSYEGALADFRRMWKKLRMGGVMVAHDAVLFANGTDYSVRSAARLFSVETGVSFFDFEGTFGIVGWFKNGDGTRPFEGSWDMELREHQRSEVSRIAE